MLPQDPEQVLTALLEATRDLVAAEDAAAVAEVAVAAAQGTLGHAHVGVHLLDEAPFLEPVGAPGDELVPVAWTDDIEAFLGGEPPAFARGEGAVWEAFESGEVRVYDDLHAETEPLDPDTGFRSEMHLPLGDHGVMLVASTDVAEFDAEDVHFAQVLAANTAAALDNLASRRALQARERELARQNVRLQRFASVVSHDIRNPLSVARGHLDLGLEALESADDTDTADARDHFETAGDALDRMERLVDDLLALSRQGEAVGEPRSTDPGAVARRAWENVETADATLEVAELDTVQADPDRLEQVFENLFRNAVEHSSTSSQNAVRSDDAVEHGVPAVHVSVGPLDDGDGFYVADDGPGIPPEERGDVFEHGYSTSADGTGLGLAIVRTVVEAHGWEVTVTESEAGGARFEVRTDPDTGGSWRTPTGE